VRRPLQQALAQTDEPPSLVTCSLYSFKACVNGITEGSKLLGPGRPWHPSRTPQFAIAILCCKQKVSIALRGINAA